MFYRESGDFNILPVTNAISTAYAKGCLIYPDGSGAFIPADATSGNHLGIAEEAITSSDARYTTAGVIAVDVLRPGDLVRVTGASGLTAAKQGTYMDIDATGLLFDVATSKNVLFLVKYISATEGIFMVNALASVKDVATT